LKRNKGLKLVNGIVDSYMIDSGEVPTDRDIVSHLLQMENWEFDQYLNITDSRERLSTLEGIQKKLDDIEQEKISRTKKDLGK
jgi:hypothetical protein